MVDAYNSILDKAAPDSGNGFKHSTHNVSSHQDESVVSQRHIRNPTLFENYGSNN
jgi:hypothetical protein